MPPRVLTVAWVLCVAAKSALTSSESMQDMQDMQKQCLRRTEMQCNKTTAKWSSTRTGGNCEPNFDGAICWRRTLAGTMAEMPCPADCIHGLNEKAKAYKYCTEQGIWWLNATTGLPYSNYSQCKKTFNLSIVPQIIKDHISNVRLIYIIGYSVSLPSLMLAVFLMTYFRRLRCQRNTVHVHLFISFILKSAVVIIKESALQGGQALSKDFVLDHAGRLTLNPNSSMWECKTLFVVFIYSLSANYVWIFGEGLYLHLLIFASNFSETNKLRWFIVGAWFAPVLWVIPWILVRTHFENELCWNVHKKKGVYWIINGPISATIVANFVFFINIIRVLFVKLRASCSADQATKYRKLARSTLVLIPLFGVHYAIFVALPAKLSDEYIVARMYIDHIFSSAEGFMVALLFCYLNSEVRTEIRKAWTRLRGYRLPSNTNSATWSRFRIVYKRTTDNTRIPVSPQHRIDNTDSDCKVQKAIISSLSSSNSRDGKVKEALMSRSLSSSNSKDGRTKDESVHSDHNDNAIDSLSAYDGDAKTETSVWAEVYE